MTVYYKNLVLECGGGVYEPAEDSFLLADNLIAGEGDSVLDVGTGSGIIALASAEKVSNVLGVDVNPEPVACARENARRNGIRNAEFQVSDLFENVSGKFDLIAFNSPYLPTEGKKEPALDGGASGRRLIEAFLREAGDFLNEEGIIQLTASSLNDVDYVKGLFSENGFRPEILAEQAFFFERLYVVSAVRE